jgi:thiol-disulfide isomerase/thioredoxin
MKGLLRILIILPVLLLPAFVLPIKLGTGLEWLSAPELFRLQEVHASAAAFRALTRPALEVDVNWVNAAPLSAAELDERVVLLHLWSAPCLPCRDAVSPLNDLWNLFDDEAFALVAIHSPEEPTLGTREAARAAIEEFGIEYPAALDKERATFAALRSRFEPATYLFAQDGRLMDMLVGSDDMGRLEAEVADLLGLSAEELEALRNKDAPVELAETVFGFAAEYRFAAGTISRNKPAAYAMPVQLAVNEWGVDGTWQISREYAELLEAPGKFRFRFVGPGLTISMDNLSNLEARVPILLDGEFVPREFQGEDLLIDADGKSYVVLEAQDWYDLLDGLSGDHTVEIDFQVPVRITANEF